MANFLENIFDQLSKSQSRVVLREVHGDTFVSVTGGELLQQVQHLREFVKKSGMQRGDRCALLAGNSIRWAAVDLALLAEGVIVVPLYARQAPAELAAMMRDCQPRMLLTSDAKLGEMVAQEWQKFGAANAAPRTILFDDIWNASPPTATDKPVPAPELAADTEIVTIIYTSGTSGEAKGGCLNPGN